MMTPVDTTRPAIVKAGEPCPCGCGHVFERLNRRPKPCEACRRACITTARQAHVWQDICQTCWTRYWTLRRAREGKP